MTYRIGVDTGGTFVDVVLSTPRGDLRLAKALTDPADLAGAVVSGLNAAAEGEGLTLPELLSQTDRIVHGSTVATNAILTRRGSSVGLITTEGFRDVLNLRRGVRDRPMDSRRAPPLPLVPRSRIFGVPERVDADGQVITPLDTPGLDAAIDQIATERLESVAVCFLFSFLDQAHEAAVRARLAERLPGCHVSLSSEVLPQLGLYERVSTTAVNAFVSPLLSSYLARLDDRLRALGFGGSLLLMQSNGGVSSVEVGRRFGVRSVLSGPAAAPVAAARIGELYGLSNLISIDMGGTSFDVCLIDGGEPQISSDSELGGYRIALSMVDIHTIGAGGGSIVGVDERGLMRVGPESAGANPGPACYGRGGTRPTITDANVLLGYVAPDFFWGGRLDIDVDAAERAMREHVADRLGLDVLTAASGAYQVVNEAMVDAIREVSVRRGFDPRQFALVAAGGAGPLHVGALAEELDIPVVVIPRLASVFCSLGGLLSDLRYESSTSLVTPLARLDPATANATIERLAAPLVEALAADGIADHDRDLDILVGLRYTGQFHEIDVPLEGGAFTTASAAQLAADFHRRHDLLNGYQEPAHTLDVITVRVLATGRTDKPALARGRTDKHDTIGDATATRRPARATANRRIHWSGSELSVRVHRRADLAPDDIVVGPAIVTEETTTLVVPPAFDLWTDPAGNAILYRKGATVDDWLARLSATASAAPRGPAGRATHPEVTAGAGR